jgi:hypothetical protein
MRSAAMPPPLLVVDTNVWLDYFAATTATADADRALLRCAKKKGVVRLLMTAPITQGLMRTCPHDGFARYAEMMRFAWNLCGAPRPRVTREHLGGGSRP